MVLCTCLYDFQESLFYCSSTNHTANVEHFTQSTIPDRNALYSVVSCSIAQIFCFLCYRVLRKESVLTWNSVELKLTPPLCVGLRLSPYIPLLKRMGLTGFFRKRILLVRLVSITIPQSLNLSIAHSPSALTRPSLITNSAVYHFRQW